MVSTYDYDGVGGTMIKKPPSEIRMETPKYEYQDRIESRRKRKRVPLDKRSIEIFLEALAETGMVTQAARAAGPTVEGFRLLRKKDEEFAALWMEALEEFRDKIESAAIKRAVEGVNKPVYQLAQYVGDITEYSDSLMQLILKGHRPERYRERVDMNQKIEGGVLVVNCETMAEDEWLRTYGAEEEIQDAEIVSNDPKELNE